MTSINEIAEDPEKALSALDKRLGAEPGALIRDMDRLGQPDEDWTRHLPYGIAVSYYEDAAGRAPYEASVGAYPVNRITPTDAWPQPAIPPAARSLPQPMSPRLKS